ncbi:MAG: DUF3667 domain-containing protein [Spirosomataceae bacterium]
MSTHKHRRKHKVCPNCGTILQPDYEFCPHCGQENHELNVPIGHLVYEFIESIFHFDIKFWNTFRAIVTKPGKITTDFVEGKRARYVPPARFYVFVAFFFFLMLNKVSEKWLMDISEKDGEEATESVYGKKETQWEASSSIKELGVLGYRQTDSLEKAMEDLPMIEQQKIIRTLKAKALTDSVNKYHDKMPYYIKDALLSTLEVSDSLLVKQSGLQINPLVDGMDLNHELSQLIKLGVFKEAQRDSLWQEFALKTTDDAYKLCWNLKDKVLNDSLNRTGGKANLSRKFKTELANIFSYDYEADSVYLTKAGIDRDLYEILHNDYTTFKIEDIKITKKQLALFRTYSEAQLDSVLRAQSPKYVQANSLSKWFTRKLFKQGLKLNGTKDKEMSELRYKEFSHLVIKYVSFVMFLMMPVVGLLLLIIFYRLKKYYYEHLIFSVHAHTVLFMLMTIGFSLDYFFGLETLGPILLLGLIYFYISLKNVYQQGWPKTTGKFLLLLLMYSFVGSLFLSWAVFFGFINL